MEAEKPLFRSYIIPGDPIALQRARNGNGRLYDPQTKEKQSCGIQIQAQHSDKRQFKGPIVLDVIFYMPVPISWTQKKRNAMIGKLHVSPPDTSNMIKFIEDAAQHILYDNDCKIAIIYAKKIYDMNPRTVFNLEEIIEEKPERIK